MISAAGRNRRMAASPFFRWPFSFSLPSFAKRVLANSPAPIVTAPAARDLPRKERRLKEPFDGLIVSGAWVILVFSICGTFFHFCFEVYFLFGFLCAFF